MKRAGLAALGGGLVFLSACTLGPDYKPPETFAETSWSEAPAGWVGEEAPALDWWRQFSDPLLERYIETALRENRNLRAAQARVRRARALRRESQAGLRPVMDGEGSASRQRVAGESGGRTRLQLGLDASWELDLFGGVRREVEAAEARIQLTVEERRGVLVGLLAEVARSYVEIRGVQKRIGITEQNIALQSRTFELVERLFQQGEASEFDITRAQGLLQSTQSRLPELDADLKSGIFRLSVLLGHAPATLLSEMLASAPLPPPPALVPVGQASDILRRRPDIRAAERELAAATADVGSATAALFPRFELLGDIGRVSRTVSGLGDSGNTAYSFGPSLNWPLLQGGGTRARIRAEEAEVDEALARYEQTVLAALADAETALVRYLREREKNLILQAALQSRKRSVELARARYNLGEENFLSVLDAERELILAEDEQVGSEIESVRGLITLYTALGGGWEVLDAEEAAP